MTPSALAAHFQILLFFKQMFLGEWVFMRLKDKVQTTILTYIHHNVFILAKVGLKINLMQNQFDEKKKYFPES